MPHDLHLEFSNIFPDPRDLKQQIPEILSHVHYKSYGIRPHLTFLAIKCDPQDPIQKSSAANQLEHQHSKKDSWDNIDNEFREFTFDDARNPHLQLSLVKTTATIGLSNKGYYVAVSYCWPAEERDVLAGDQLSHPISVIEPDGSCRPSRAAPHILRRAVKHAASLSRKYIWIDQECINQENSDEKEAAIQSMDMVYRDRRAHILCLLDLEIADQETVSILEAFHEYNRGGAGREVYFLRRSIGGMSGTPEIARILTKILSQVADDRWFTRAWIMHERLCSATRHNTELWLTCKPGLFSSIQGEVCLMVEDQLEDAADIASHLERGRNQDDDQTLPSAFQIGPVEPDDIDWARSLRPEVLFSNSTDEEAMYAAQALRSATARLRKAYKLIKPASFRRTIGDPARSYYGATQVASLLEPLGCLYPSDKIAMLANICRWEFRLDSREIDKRGWSFSLIFWVLAIANGDGSFFCAEACCKTKPFRALQTWAPLADTRLGSIECSGLLDHVSMHLSSSGLQVEGWLWKSDRFIDLSVLKPVIESIDKSVPQVETSGWVNGKFEHFYKEDEQRKLCEFFWALLLKLSELSEHECANLVWEAAKLRYSGGFYGRTLQTIPITTFDKVVAKGTSNYIACYESLGISEEDENDYDYIQYGPIAPSVVEYLRQNCEHHKWERQLDVENDCSDTEKSKDDEDLAKPPCQVLLGEEEQLKGLSWIRSAVLSKGGISLGLISPGTPRRRDMYYPDSDSDSDEHGKNLVSGPKMAILDIPQGSEENHVFILHREVRKYKSGDGKALRLVHPFDVWLKDSPNHTDAPFCWSASVREGNSLHIKENANALFDIGEIRRMTYEFSWPQVYNQATWE